MPRPPASLTGDRTSSAPESDELPDHLDVLIVGAGLSGIGAAAQLAAKRPGTSFALLEAREAIGGTWDLFRYPGVRSDSDMFTLGYSFRPWRGEKSIADGPSILRYIRETARETGVDRHIRYRRRAVRAEWSSEDARWTVEVERTDTGAREQVSCGFLYLCSGYYRYDQGYLPDFPGMDRYRGRLVHPQHWPDDLDYAGKRVVVIGSGATAVTLVPAMAEQAAHVTMLQRSPSYIASLPARDPLAQQLRRLLPPNVAYRAIRWKNILLTQGSYVLSRRKPELMKRVLRKGVERHLPPGFDVDTHFTPRYNPWDQRLCLVPDADLFQTIAAGRASIETDRIETFTETGIRLASGRELDADIVVTATGLQMLALGGLTLVVDGREVKPSETVGYKGMMLSGVPNLAAAVGYTNASWTLKADLISDWVCRLLAHMEARGYQQVTPRWPEPELPQLPFFDLTSGYVQRSIATFPRQGSAAPWRLYQNYLRDRLLFRRDTFNDPLLEFRRARRAKRPAPQPVAA